MKQNSLFIILFCIILLPNYAQESINLKLETGIYKPISYIINGNENIEIVNKVEIEQLENIIIEFKIYYNFGRVVKENWTLFIENVNNDGNNVLGLMLRHNPDSLTYRYDSTPFEIKIEGEIINIKTILINGSEELFIIMELRKY